MLMECPLHNRRDINAAAPNTWLPSFLVSQVTIYVCNIILNHRLWTNWSQIEPLSRISVSSSYLTLRN